MLVTVARFPPHVCMCAGQADINTALVQSNIVIFQVRPPHTPSAVLAALKARGVLVIPFMGGIRMVTHNDVSTEDCQAALAALTEVLAEEPVAQNGHSNGHCNGHTATGVYGN